MVFPNSRSPPAARSLMISSRASHQRERSRRRWRKATAPLALRRAASSAPSEAGGKNVAPCLSFSPSFVWMAAESWSFPPATSRAAEIDVRRVERLREAAEEETLPGLVGLFLRLEVRDEARTDDEEREGVLAGRAALLEEGRALDGASGLLRAEVEQGLEAGPRIRRRDEGALPGDADLALLVELDLRISVGRLLPLEGAPQLLLGRGPERREPLLDLLFPRPPGTTRISGPENWNLTPTSASFPRRSAATWMKSFPVAAWNSARYFCNSWPPPWERAWRMRSRDFSSSRALDFRSSSSRARTPRTRRHPMTLSGMYASRAGSSALPGLPDTRVARKSAQAALKNSRPRCMVFASWALGL